MFKSLEYYKPNIDETVKWYQKMYHDALNHKKVTFLLERYLQAMLITMKKWI